MVRSVHDFARYNSDTHYAQHSNNRRTTVPGRQHFRPVTKFTVFCNSQSVTLCRTYLKTVFFFLTAQCLRVYQASCRCCWYIRTPHFKRILFFLIMRTQKPVQFNAGSFFVVSLETFSHVTYTAY